MKTNLILESLANLDHDGAADLFDNAIKSGIFMPFSGSWEEVMFIFPDGRVLCENAWEGTIHNDLYDVRSPDKYVNRRNADHPALDPKLAEYYNLIIVLPYGQGHGGIIIPEKTDPTDEQYKVIDTLRTNGYQIALSHEVLDYL